jgi:macrolide-specific efflux system membrane fusion protein
MSASAEVVVEEVENAVTVASEAITSGPRKTVTVKAGDKEVTRTVTTGLVGDETTEIVSGLEPGQTVVLPEATVATGGLEGTPGGSEGDFPSGGFTGGGLPSGGFPGGP